jgi:hypothetical protein
MVPPEAENSNLVNASNETPADMTREGASMTNARYLNEIDNNDNMDAGGGMDDAETYSWEHLRSDTDSVGRSGRTENNSKSDGSGTRTRTSVKQDMT